jgi:ABC-type transport system involved in cytochrome bd biosynthesis fused ATPase/permease subunit
VDQIILLDGGRQVATGTHEQLLRSSALYREIYESQLGPVPVEFQAESPAAGEAAS